MTDTAPRYRTAIADRRRNALVHRVTTSSAPLTYTDCGINLTFKGHIWTLDNSAVTVTCPRCLAKWPIGW